MTRTSSGLWYLCSLPPPHGQGVPDREDSESNPVAGSGAHSISGISYCKETASGKELSGAFRVSELRLPIGSRPKESGELIERAASFPGRQFSSAAPLPLR